MRYCCIILATLDVLLLGVGAAHAGVLNETFEDGDWITNPTWTPLNGLPEPVVTDDPLRPNNKVLSGHGWEWGHGSIATDVDVPYNGFEFASDFLSSNERFQVGFGLLTVTGDGFSVVTELEDNRDEGHTSWRLWVGNYYYNRAIPGLPVNEWWRIRLYHDPLDGMVHGEVSRASDGVVLATLNSEVVALPTDRSIERLSFGPDTSYVQYVDNIWLPEPTTVVLMGLACIVATQRRRSPTIPRRPPGPYPGIEELGEAFRRSTGMRSPKHGPPVVAPT